MEKLNELAYQDESQFPDVLFRALQLHRCHHYLESGSKYP